jgi:hypothetical protein
MHAVCLADNLEQKMQIQLNASVTKTGVSNQINTWPVFAFCCHIDIKAVDA